MNRELNRDQFPCLCECFGYFHQDWPDFDATIEQVIEHFKSVCPDAVGRAIAEISMLLAMQPEESEILRLMALAGCALDPRVGYGSAEQWLVEIRELLRTGTGPKAAMLAAAQSGDLPALQKAAADPDFLHDIEFTMKVFIWACEMDHFHVADWFLQQGVDINNRDDRGQTPLEHAVFCGNISASQYLLEHGASPNLRTWSGASVLHIAVDTEVEAAIAESEEQKRHVPASDTLTRLLIDFGTDITAKDKDGRTALDWAVGRGHKAAEQLLRSLCREN